MPETVIAAHVVHAGVYSLNPVRISRKLLVLLVLTGMLQEVILAIFRVQLHPQAVVERAAITIRIHAQSLLKRAVVPHG
jgi:hypothetical protein